MSFARTLHRITHNFYVTFRLFSFCCSICPSVSGFLINWMNQKLDLFAPFFFCFRQINSMWWPWTSSAFFKLFFPLFSACILSYLCYYVEHWTVSSVKWYCAAHSSFWVFFFCFSSFSAVVVIGINSTFSLQRSKYKKNYVHLVGIYSIWSLFFIVRSFVFHFMCSLSSMLCGAVWTEHSVGAVRTQFIQFVMFDSLPLVVATRSVPFCNNVHFTLVFVIFIFILCFIEISQHHACSFCGLDAVIVLRHSIHFNFHWILLMR